MPIRNDEEIILDKILNNQITKRIENLISIRNISAYKLMKDLELNKPTFYKCLNGESYWSVGNLIKIAHYFNVSLDWLIDGEERTRSPNEYENRIKELEEENRLLRDRISQISNLTQAIEEIKKRKGKR